MVQGNTKNLKPKSPPKRAVKQDLKKGRRAIAPKKAVAVKQAKLRQELSAKINRSVEGQMVSAASSGKLTIMKNAAQASTDTKTKKS
ncbi:hypothetical protein EXIGLDRAFT_734653 [Exidia glandulosa HHB12029]|uniref:Uncharacterized protein n=1 Tax=Exidia glandulosa HHB12029 TaxID=1314781 RepID=A0A165K510_EXIGL|nr:hypothetical protein EXIGLDRAFT_734653 [Exidia glandulosa HHB12029]